LRHSPDFSRVCARLEGESRAHVHTLSSMSSTLGCYVAHNTQLNTHNTC
jgi:hypothetical protein